MEDLISRQTIISGLKFVIEHGIETDGAHSISAEAMLEFVRELPTVQPNIVRCKDCKWWKDSDGIFRRGTGAESKCPLNLHQVYEGTFYCGLGERREVTT